MKSIYIDIQVRAIDDSLNIEDANKKDTLHVPIKSVDLTVIDGEDQVEDCEVDTQPASPKPESTETNTELSKEPETIKNMTSGAKLEPEL